MYTPAVRKVSDTSNDVRARLGWNAWLREPWLATGLVVALAVAVSLRAVLRWSLWRDEIASVTVSERSVHGIQQVLHHTDAALGLYYAMLHFWLQLGTSDAFVRLPSLACFTVAAAVTVLLGAETIGWRCGVLAGLLFATSSLAINAAADARPYSLVVLLATLATLLFIKAVERPSAALLVSYTLLAILAIYAHFLAALVIVAHIFAVLVQPRATWKRFIVPYSTIGILSAPLIAFVALQQGSQVGWIPRLSTHSILATAGQLTGNTALLVCFALLGSVALVSDARMWASRSRIDVWQRYVIWLCLLVPPLFIIAISVVKPLLLSRYLDVTLPMLAIVAARGVLALPQRSVQPIAACTIVALSAVSTVHTISQPFRAEDPKALAAMVARDAAPGDVVTFAPAYTRLSFDYYFAQLPEHERSKLIDVALTKTPGQTGNLYATELPAAQLADALQGKPRIWVIGAGALFPQPPSKAPEPMIAVEHMPMFRDYQLTRVATFGGLHAELFVRK